MHQPAASSPHKRIAIFLCWEGTRLPASPAVQSLLTFLAEDGFEIDLFTRTSVPDLHLFCGRVRNIVGTVEQTDGTRRLASFTWLRLRRQFPLLNGLVGRYRLYRDIMMKRIQAYVSYWYPPAMVMTPSFHRAVKRRLAEQSYDWVIGIEEEGLIAAHAYLPDLPLIHYSLELYYEEHPHYTGLPYWKRFKQLFRAAFAHLDMLIVQDEDRARVVFQDAHQPYDPQKVRLFPVSYPGPAQRYRSHYLRQRFPDIGDRPILLQFGSIEKRRCSPNLIRATRLCPPDLAVIFHGNFRDRASLQALKIGRCRVSGELVPFERLVDIPASADIGLVFYADISENERLIAHASGQLALFLKCGVPVIVDHKPSMRSLVQTYHCGVAVEHADDIFDAARHILADYEAYCQGALECFAREHDLREPYARIRERIELRGPDEYQESI